MKILVASDIHGSAYYTEKLLARMEEEKVDKLVLLGDIFYHKEIHYLKAMNQ